MTVKQDKFAAFALAIIFAGLSFLLPYKLVEWWFGMHVPPLQFWQVVVLGNISVLLFTIAISLTQSLTIRVIMHKKTGGSIDE